MNTNQNPQTEKFETFKQIFIELKTNPELGYTKNEVEQEITENRKVIDLVFKCFEKYSDIQNVLLKGTNSELYSQNRMLIRALKDLRQYQVHKSGFSIIDNALSKVENNVDASTTETENPNEFGSRGYDKQHDGAYADDED